MQFVALFSMHINIAFLALSNTHTNIQSPGLINTHINMQFLALFNMHINIPFLALSNSHINIRFLASDQAVMDGLDSVEVAPAKTEGDSQSTYAAEEQLWRHEFFRDCLAPKKAAFEVNGSPCQHLSVHNPSTLPYQWPL